MFLGGLIGTLWATRSNRARMGFECAKYVKKVLNGLKCAKNLKKKVSVWFCLIVRIRWSFGMISQNMLNWGLGS